MIRNVKSNSRLEGRNLLEAYVEKSNVEPYPYSGGKSYQYWIDMYAKPVKYRGKTVSFEVIPVNQSLVNAAVNDINESGKLLSIFNYEGRKKILWCNTKGQADNPETHIAAVPKVMNIPSAIEVVRQLCPWATQFHVYDMGSFTFAMINVS